MKACDTNNEMMSLNRKRKAWAWDKKETLKQVDGTNKGDLQSKSTLKPAEKKRKELKS